jgi:hypothetical protein
MRRARGGRPFGDGVEALATHSQIMTHVGNGHLILFVLYPSRPIIIRCKKRPLQPPKGTFCCIAVYGELLIDLPCIARTYRFSVHPSPQSLLMYGTTTRKEWRWRDPYRVAILGMVHIHTSTSGYLPFTRFFVLPLPKLKCYLKAVCFNNRPSLNTTSRKRDIEYPGRF